MAQGVRPAEAGISIGQVFLGKYRVDSILGQGGMGVVAECTHLALNERVAIKMLRQDVLLDNDAVQRFIREAQAAVKLKSEYVARVSDVGTFENGVPYMVMEFLEGMDVGQLLKERGVLPVPWATELMLQTAEALAEAHSLGIVHRDVKPTNLFVTWRPDGSALVKVLDFGISKSPMGTDMQLTQTQSLLGTPAYMSPEQMRSARLVDSRSDIWSLGTVFYEVLEGRRPFEAESFSEMCVKVAVDPPAPMVNTPPQLQAVILRCLAKTAEQRYPSMADLARDLVPFVADPHSAIVLVERMQRMLRRAGTHDWEGGGTGVGQRALSGSSPGIRPMPARAMTQQPPQWGAGSDPAVQPWRVKSDPAIAPYQEKSAPYVAPHLTTNNTVSVKPKSRAWIFVALLAAIAAGAVAFGVTRSSKPAGEHAEQANPTQPEIQKIEPANPTVNPTNPPVNPTTNPTNPVATGSAAGSAETPPEHVGKTIDTPTGEKPTGEKPTGEKPSGEKSGRTLVDKGPKHPPVIRAGGGNTVKTGIGTTKTGTKTGSGGAVPKETKSDAPDSKQPCDAFASMHGCDNK